ncbi:MAG: SMP-30/gluconolactonase/LRE family protein [Spirochaetota bacterium]
MSQVSPNFQAGYSEGLGELLCPNSKLERLCSGAIWAEGPVWFAGPLPEQDYVLFSDVKANRLLRYNAASGLQVEKAYSHYSNGNYRDLEGNLLSCEHGRRCISRTYPSGAVEILVDRLEDRRLNSPNDLVVKSDGTVWFSDPPYGILSNEEGYRAESQIIGCYVYCYSERNQSLQIATMDVQRPNGLAFSPDEKYLYVADMSCVEFPISGYHHLLRYEVVGTELRSKEVFAEISPGIPDGLRVDYHGNIFCSCEDGILVIGPHGQTLGKIHVPERVSNCTFGGREQDYLYITATTSLYGIKLKTCGVQYNHLGAASLRVS